MLRSNRNNNSSGSSSMTTSSSGHQQQQQYPSASSSSKTPPSFSLSAACSSISPFAWAIIGFLIFLLFLGSGGPGGSTMMSDIAMSAPRHHFSRHHRLERGEIAESAVAHEDREGGAEMDTAADFHHPQMAKMARGAPGHWNDAKMKQRKGGASPATKKRPMTITMSGNIETKTQAWTRARDDLIEKVVPELGIIIVSQEETEAVNLITDTNDPQFYNRYQVSNGHYVLSVPADERLNKFREILTKGRLGTLSAPLTERRKLVEAPMKDLEVEIKLAEADLERIQKLSSETAKNLDEKLQLNSMLRDALRSLEYLKSQQRKITSQVEYAEVTLSLNERYPVYPEKPETPTINWAEVFFVVAIFSLAAGTLYCMFSQKPAAVAATTGGERGTNGFVTSSAMKMAAPVPATIENGQFSKEEVGEGGKLV